VADILKGLVGGGSTFLFAWVLPSAIALAALDITVFRRLGIDAALGITALGFGEQALLLGLAATVLGLVMNALSTPMYRLLEGYLLPGWLRQRLTEGQHRLRQSIEHQVETASGVDRNLYQERLRRFPRDPDQTAPTSLGNALRAFETYGFDRFRMDSQLFWSELVGLASDSLRKELEMARSSVDFFVAATWLSAIVGVVASVAAFMVRPGPDGGILAVGVASLILSPISYRSAVASSAYWDSTVRALVNLGRLPLAKALGLDMPATIQEERRMWNRTALYNYFGPDEGRSARMNEFRLGATKAPTASAPVPAPKTEAPAESSATATSPTEVSEAAS
jgi:hypothetical protein